MAKTPITPWERLRNLKVTFVNDGRSKDFYKKDDSYDDANNVSKKT